MKYLQIINALVAALAATLALVLGVVTLLFWTNLKIDPSRVTELRSAGGLALAFIPTAVVALAAFLGHRRSTLWRWPAQVLLAPAAAATVWAIARILG